MIQNNIVFVIGAGASVPYGFPSGPQLLEEYKGVHPHTVSQSTDGAADPYSSALLISAISEASVSSIDALLEHRKDLEDSGKKLIAERLLRSERQYLSQPKAANDWLQYLIGLMSEEARCPQEFGTNKVSFITYNYDRLIEYRLFKHIGAVWRAGEPEIADVLNQIPIIHLHGSLGELKNGADFVAFGGEFQTSEGYEPPRRNAVITKSATYIKVVHQVDGSTPQFARAQNILRAANVVFFLGFSFGRANVRRLGFTNIPTAKVVACNYGLTSDEFEKSFVRLMNAAKGRNHDYSFQPNWDCLRVLRENATQLV